MNKGKKAVLLSLIFIASGVKAAITRGDLEAVGSILREAHHLKAVIPPLPNELDQYVLTPITALGEFLWNLDILEPEITNSLKGLKSFKLLASCSKIPAEYLTLPEDQLKAKLKPVDLDRALKARKACPQIACTGDRLACMIQGIENLSTFLVSVEKALFGYYKADGKSYLLCPQGKGCSKIPGVSEVVLGISQQQQIYNNVLKPKVQEPLAKVINILDQLVTILTKVKGGKQSETITKPAAESAVTKASETAQETSSIPEAPALETASNIPEAPEGEVPDLSPKQRQAPINQPKKPTQQQTERPAMPSAKEFQEGAKSLRPTPKPEKEQSSEEQRLERIRQQTETPGSWETD